MPICYNFRWAPLWNPLSVTHVCFLGLQSTNVYCVHAWLVIPEAIWSEAVCQWCSWGRWRYITYSVAALIVLPSAFGLRKEPRNAAKIRNWMITSVNLHVIITIFTLTALNAMFGWRAKAVLRLRKFDVHVLILEEQFALFFWINNNVSNLIL